MRSLALLCAALLGSLVPRAAAAQELDPSQAGREVARERFERGIGLMVNENWVAAAIEFERSLEAYPTRQALFNLANCRKALHRYGEALLLFQRWSENYGDAAPPEEVASVAATLRELRTYLAEIVLHVEPAGAQVRVDDRSVGLAPLAAPITVDAGDHLIRATLDGHHPAEVQVEVASQERAEIHLTLLPVAVEPHPPVGPDDPLQPRPPDHPPGPPGGGEPVPPVGGPEPAADGLHPAGFWTVAAAAVAAGVGGAVTAALLPGREDDINDALADRRTGDPAACRRGPGLIDDYDTLQTATNVLLFGGGALAVTALVLALFTDFGGDDEHPPPVQVTAGPTPGHGAALGLTFAF